MALKWEKDAFLLFPILPTFSFEFFLAGSLFFSQILSLFALSPVFLTEDCPWIAAELFPIHV